MDVVSTVFLSPITWGDALAIGLDPGIGSLMAGHVGRWLGAALLLPAASFTDLFGDDEQDGAAESDDDDLFGDDGGFDDDDDIFGGGDGDDGLEMGNENSVNELEGRVHEVEVEIDDISSSISQVRNENEQIGETVEEIEGHVRDLLEIYETVTQGVNPFVDGGEAGQVPPGGGGQSGGGADLGLFAVSDGDPDPDPADEVNYFQDEPGTPGGDGAGVADEPASGGGGDTVVLDDEPDGVGEDALDGNKSFQELKDQYENDANEAGQDAEPGSDGAPDPGPEVEAGDEEAETAAGESEQSREPTVETTDGPDEPNAGGGELEFLGDRDSTIRVVRNGARGSTGKSRPHLQRFPVGYVADLTAMTWLEELIDVGGRGGAEAALQYYVDIGWISEDVRGDLDAMLDGIGDPGGGEPVDRPLAAYGSADHRRSLSYVYRLAGDPDRTAAFDHLDTVAGGMPNGS